MEYIRSLNKPDGCFLCDYVQNPQNDSDNFVLWRAKRSFVVFNRYPYNNGHMLICPNRHIADLSEAMDEEMAELMKLVREIQKVLTAAIRPQGFNVGMNFGRCAGAGLPGHLHIHIVPRWNGDTNYMAVCGGTDVISQGLRDLYDQLRRISDEQKLPSL
ncbi:MAG: HIT domain-containing protein [Phycisphaerae bacterium]|nr:HIT domain-containing protein [Phycisphaerae bacterium]